MKHVVGGLKRPKAESHIPQVAKNRRSSPTSWSVPSDLYRRQRDDGWGTDTGSSPRQNKSRHRRSRSWSVRRPNDGWDDIDEQWEPLPSKYQSESKKERTAISKGCEQTIFRNSQRRVPSKSSVLIENGWRDVKMTSSEIRDSRNYPTISQPSMVRRRVKYSIFADEDGDTEQDIQSYFQRHGISIGIKKIEALYYKNDYDLEETIAQLQREFKYVTLPESSLTDPQRRMKNMERAVKPFQSGPQRGMKNTLERETQAKKNPLRNQSRRLKTLNSAPAAHLQQKSKPRTDCLLKNFSASVFPQPIGRFAIWEPSYHSCARHIKYGVNPKLLHRWWMLIMDCCKWVNPPVTSRTIPRLISWFTCEGCSCVYKHSGTISKPVTFPRWLCDIAKLIMNVLGFDRALYVPTCCNISFYRDGTDCVGWHSDDEELFGGVQENKVVVSLSLGQTRSFQMRLKHKPGSGELNLNPVTTTVLEHGDIFTMEGHFQRFYQHRVPPEPNRNQPRLNLTFRWIMRHNRGCSMAR